MKEYKTFMEGKVLEKRRNVVNHRTTEYQYGSAVRKLQSVPEIHTYEHERRIEEQERKIKSAMQTTLGVSAVIKLVEPRSLPRSEGKAKRVVDR